MNAMLSIILFVAAYIFIASEKINKTIVALMAAGIAVMAKLVPFHAAVEAIDLNVVFLLVGMMVSVHILSKTGFFEWAAISIARKTRGEPLAIMMLLLCLTAVLSAFLDNVTTIILVVPVTILIAQLLEIEPQPFIILEVLASNIGGTATLIGDPPNIVIGSSADLSFNDFLFNLGPGIAMIFIVFLGVVWFTNRKNMDVPQRLKDRFNDAQPELAIVDRVSMVKSLSVFAVMFIGFFIHGFLGVEPGIIALFMSMIMMLVCGSDGDEMLAKAEWGVIFFFVGMFMLVAALEYNGVIEHIGHGMLGVVKGNLGAACIVILWGSAICSAILDNIPFVIAMVPLIQGLVLSLAAQQGVTDQAIIHHDIAQPLWWSLALGACLGGNGTLVGASANVVMAGLSEKNKCPVSFAMFFKYSFWFTMLTLLLSTVYVVVRYL